MDKCIHSLHDLIVCENGVKRWCSKCKQWIFEQFPCPAYDANGQCVHPIVDSCTSGINGSPGVCVVCHKTGVLPVRITQAEAESAIANLTMSKYRTDEFDIISDDYNFPISRAEYRRQHGGKDRY